MRAGVLESVNGAVADVMGFGWPEDQVTATSTAAWIGSYATIQGNANPPASR